MILTIIGIFFILIFFAPAAGARVLNIGNITGMAVGALLIAFSLLRRHIGRGVLRLLLVCTVIIAVIASIETFCMLQACHQKPEENATVIVLGCKVRGSVPSLSLRERIDTAADWLLAHPDAVCIASGGQGPDEYVTEARCIADQLIDMGIPAERILLEENSTSTEENIRFSLRIIQEQGLNSRVALVTNDYHIYRASRLASEAGLVPGAVPAKTALYLLPTYYIRELYGILAAWFL